MARATTTSPSPAPPPPTSSPRRLARRAELLEAALRVIRRGHGRVAMEDIAAEAGISRPILYRHFGDAAGLYAAVADRFCRDMLARLRENPETLGPGRALLRAQILAYLSFIAEEPDVYRFLAHQSPPDRPRAATHGSGFSRMVADDRLRFLTMISDFAATIAPYALERSEDLGDLSRLIEFLHNGVVSATA